MGDRAKAREGMGRWGEVEQGGVSVAGLVVDVGGWE